MLYGLGVLAQFFCEFYDVCEYSHSIAFFLLMYGVPQNLQ